MTQGGLDFKLAHYRRPCELADDERYLHVAVDEGLEVSDLFK